MITDVTLGDGEWAGVSGRKTSTLLVGQALKRTTREGHKARKSYTDPPRHNNSPRPMALSASV